MDYMKFVNECKQYLDLRGSRLTKERLETLVPYITENIRIKHLDLSQNHFKDGYGSIIAKVMEHADSIVELNLKSNDLENIGAKYIGQALGCNDNIEVLDISWNHIRWPGAVCICRGLQSNLCLTTLNVSHNGFGYEGSIAVAEMLKRNKTLQNLDISSNRICWKAAIVLSKGLTKNRTLISLKMSSNPLTTTGAMDLLLAQSATGSAVEHFDIHDIHVVEEFKLLYLAIKKKKRNFNCEYGRIVEEHDLLGRREDPKVDPLTKLLHYLRKEQIRPLEFLRSFDKPSEWSMKSSAFIERLKGCDTGLYQHEIRHVTGEIKRAGGGPEERGGVGAGGVRDSGGGTGRISYGKLINSVSHHKHVLRQQKQVEQCQKRKQQLYEQRILETHIAG
ncbi:leucine-rich repeat-containing protein 74B-like [Argonauta hians]